jgi:hypothetical protein
MTDLLPSAKAFRQEATVRRDRRRRLIHPLMVSRARVPASTTPLDHRYNSNPAVNDEPWLVKYRPIHPF